MDDGSAFPSSGARPVAVLFPLPAGDLFTTRDAVLAGATARHLEWAVRRGRLHRVRRGVLCAAETWAAAGPEQRAALAARAYVLVAPRTSGVVSHVTAAALLGLPVPADAAGAVWTTLPPGARPRRDDGIVRQVAALPPADVVLVEGIACTSALRTVSDCLRHLPALDAVPLADAALRAEMVDADELAGFVARHRWPRAAAATELLGLLNARRESVLESRSAVVFHQYGLPRPEEQVRILDASGRFVGRADFVWRDRGVVGEADGLAKYAGDDAARVVAKERRRHAEFAALGLVVMRWTEGMLHGDPPLVVVQVTTALEAGNGSRFRGRFA